MSFTPATLAAVVVAVSFAAGLNVYATMLTLGLMARVHWVVLPSGLDALADWWVIVLSGVLFSAEFVADKLPGFDLVWNAAHTFVRIPLALLLAYGATSHLSPQLQLLATVAGGVIAAITHGSKLAVRGAVTASPEPLSNIALSATEDATAIGITWAATHHPMLAGTAAGIALLVALVMARLAIRTIRRLWRKLTERAATIPLLKTVFLFALLSLCFCRLAKAQTLARPGWAGSGLTAQPWWKHAVIYEIDMGHFEDNNGGGFNAVARRLDYLKWLGVDAVLLDSVNAGNSPTNPQGQQATLIDPAIGTDGDFDELLRQASRRNLRVLLDLHQNGTSADTEILAQARSWLSRGVAGFRLVNLRRGGAAPDAFGAALRSELRKLLASYVGQRVLITSKGDAAASFHNAGRQTQGWLALDPALLVMDPHAAGHPSVFRNKDLAAQIHMALERSTDSGQAALLLRASDAGDHLPSFTRFGDGVHDVAIARSIAAVLLGSRSPVLLFSGQEYGSSRQPGEHSPDTETVDEDVSSKSLLNFYRELSRLHNGNTALRDGEEIFLNHDDEDALIWIRKPSIVTQLSPAIVIACNLADRPLSISLKGDFAGLHLKGTFLRTLLRSDAAMGSMHIDPLTLPPFGVYIGELRY